MVSWLILAALVGLLACHIHDIVKERTAEKRTIARLKAIDRKQQKNP